MYYILQHAPLHGIILNALYIKMLQYYINTMIEVRN